MRIGTLIRKWRQCSEVRLADVAKEIGVSKGTLSRIEAGRQVDGETIAKILVWLFARTGRQRLDYRRVRKQ